MRDFIRDHLGPLFQKRGLDTEIWTRRSGPERLSGRILTSELTQFSVIRRHARSSLALATSGRAKGRFKEPMGAGRTYVS